MRFGINSQCGPKHDSNQDFVLCSPEHNLFILCDGMGGYAGGAVAAEQTANFLIAALSQSLIGLSDEQAIIEEMKASIAAANNYILDCAAKNPEYSHMGTTVVVAYFLEEKLYLCHLGDSRAYHYQPGLISQIGKDHSVVQDYIDQGLISTEEAYNHPERHFVKRSVGMKTKVEADVNIVNCEDQDIVLLCSDGISDVLRDNQIMSIIADGTDLDSSAKKLVDEAFNFGSKDDASAILIAK